MSISTKIRRKKLPGDVWGSTLSTDGNDLVLDIRMCEPPQCGYKRLSLSTFELHEIPFENTMWWSKLEGCLDGYLYIVHYTDRNDPNKQEKWRVDMDTGAMENTDDAGYGHIQTVGSIGPCVYEAGTEFHGTVCQYLKEALPLACEYLEIHDKMIMSYYLRSDNGFDRFIVLLNDEGVIWKAQIDESMKGFSPGSFFVYNHRLIFFKNRNEVCCYPV